MNISKVQKRQRQRKTKLTVIVSNWTVEQDCYLIEHAGLSIEELQLVLPFSEDEIKERKACLGLIRRSKQLRKFNQ